MITNPVQSIETKHGNLSPGVVSTLVIGVSVAALGLAVSAVAADALAAAARQLSIIVWALS